MEFIDVVNERNQVIGQIAKSELYEKKPHHRIVHVLLYNDRGEMALQLRSSTVSFCPNHWVTTVGGHVQAGETTEAAAKREMMEEIGVDLPLEHVFDAEYLPPTLPGVIKFLTIFKATYNGPFTPDPNDVAKVEYFPMSEIYKMPDRGAQFHPELSFLISKLTS
ncbi:MAG: NUDIX domain-containing protein [Patescibacteria group bacterium]|jgi:8-oxo-dGTP pyrophosphatase MutT (NUDIX family)